MLCCSAINSSVTDMALLAAGRDHRDSADTPDQLRREPCRAHRRRTVTPVRETSSPNTVNRIVPRRLDPTATARGTRRRFPSRAQDPFGPRSGGGRRARADLDVRDAGRGERRRFGDDGHALGSGQRTALGAVSWSNWLGSRHPVLLGVALHRNGRRAAASRPSRRGTFRGTRRSRPRSSRGCRRARRRWRRRCRRVRARPR